MIEILPLIKGRAVLDPVELSPVPKEEAFFLKREVSLEEFAYSENWSLDLPIKE